MLDDFWIPHKKPIIWFPASGAAIFLAWWATQHLNLTMSSTAILIGGLAWCVGFGVCAAQDFRTTYFSPVWLWRFCVPGSALLSFGMNGAFHIFSALIFAAMFATPQFVGAIASRRTLPAEMRKDPDSEKIWWRLKNWGDIDIAFLAGFFVGGYSAVTLSSAFAGYLSVSCVLLVTVVSVGLYNFRQKTKELQGASFRDIHVSMCEHYFVAPIVGLWLLPLADHVF